MKELQTALLRAAHVSVLFSFAVTQPVFEALGREPSYFASYSADGLDLALFATALVLGPYAVILLLELIAMRFLSELRAERAHRGLIGIGYLLLGLTVANRIGGWTAGWGELVVTGLAVGVGLLLYSREGVRTAITVLTPAPVVFAAVLVAQSAAGEAFFFTDEARPADLDLRATPPVVIVILDELPTSSLMARDGLIDRHRFPRFAELAERTTWYRNATTTAAGTTDAVPSMLSGLRPRSGRGLSPEAVKQNLFTLLAPTYRFTSDLVAAPGLCPPGSCPIEDEGMQRLRRLTGMVEDSTVVAREVVGGVPFVGRARPVEALGLDRRERRRGLDDDAAGYGGGDRFSAIRGQIRAMEIGEGTVSLLHAPFPHWPWNHYADGKVYEDFNWHRPGIGSDLGRWVDSPRAVRYWYARHLLQVGATDVLVGELIDRLRRDRLWDEAMVVVTADHGAGFRPGLSHRRWPTGDAVTDIAAVPLFVKLPGQTEGRVVDHPVETIDLVPTIATIVGATPASQFDGRPLAAAGPATRRRVLEDGPGFKQELSPAVTPVLEAAQHKYDSFGLYDAPVSDVQRFFAWGARRNLIGAPVSDYTQGPPLRVDPAVFQRVGSGRASMEPRSWLSKSRDRTFVGLDLVAVVDGKLRAVVEAFEWRGYVHMLSLFDESSPTPISPQFFAVTEGPSGPVLRRLAPDKAN